MSKKPVQPPITRLHIRAALALAAAVATVMILLLVMTDREVLAVRWAAAVIVDGCITVAAIGTAMTFYARHQKRQRKDDAEAARLTNVLWQAEQQLRRD